MLTVLVLSASAACWALSGTPLAFFRPAAQQTASYPAAAGLTLAERVAYQRAIEEVYWRHRIWPKENAAPKPSLDQVMSQAQLQRKVEDYLRNSQAMEDYWQRLLTAEQLQAEMDRMAKHTKQPEVLHELFDALANDPFVIAECLARAVLAERCGNGNSVAAGVPPAHPTGMPPQKPALAGWLVKAEAQVPVTMAAVSANYTLPVIASPAGGCTDDTWTPTTTTNGPAARWYHTAVWTGSEMIVWGGRGSGYVNTGGRYNPSTDSWTTTSTTGAPSARESHTAVWTGSEMIVWGGYGNAPAFNTGGRYNPSTDSWTPTSTTNAPSARSSHTAVWTGNQMIAWGGNTGSNWVNTGGRYNPSSDSWTATTLTNAPAARSHCSVDRERDDHLGRIRRRLPFEHRRQIQSKQRQLDSYQPHQRARWPPMAHGSVDGQRNDRLGRIRSRHQFQHRRQI